ncbi:hypothetical protein L1887_63476 [Cichorium endivia]|nr:hypothetical protein L1887_63476 [Cichorium endivia]
MRRSEDAARRPDQANLLLARGRHAHWPGSEIALALMRATASLFVRSRSRSPLPTHRASCRASVGLRACWLSKPGRAMAGFDVIQAYRRVGSRRCLSCPVLSCPVRGVGRYRTRMLIAGPFDKTDEQEKGEARKRDETYLGGLADLLPDDLPLVVLVVFDRLQQRRALLDRSADAFSRLKSGCVRRTKLLTSSSANSA